MGNSTNLVVNCIVFSLSCIVILLGLIVSYDIVRYTLFGRRYLRVSNDSFLLRENNLIKWMDCCCCLAQTYSITEKLSYYPVIRKQNTNNAIPAYESDEVL